MIRLFIKDYTLQERMELYDSLNAALSKSDDYGCSDLVLGDLQRLFTGWKIGSERRK